MITGKKNFQIYTSRSKHIIDNEINSKRNVFSDEKMTHSINLYRPTTPLNFQESGFNRMAEMSLKKTDS